MQNGSLVECVKNPPLAFFTKRALDRLKLNPPVLHSYYVVEDIKACSCGQHDNLLLQEIPGIAWPDVCFREVQPPQKMIDILKEIEPVLNAGRLVNVDDFEQAYNIRR